MNLKILPSANVDLINGYHFYERQSQGLGSYFIDSLFSDIDSLLTPSKGDGSKVPNFEVQ